MPSFENRIQRDLLTETVFSDSAEEFVLPDYMPEIGRVLRLSTTLLPDEPYLGTEGAEFSGRIEYRLLYSDGEGRVTEAPLEGHYRYRVPIPEKGGEHAYTEERIESVSARPSAPRKLGIRARIVSRPHLLADGTVGASPELLMAGERCEVLDTEAQLMRRIPLRFDAIHAEGRFMLEDVNPDELRLLSASASLLPENAEAHDGYISVRGKIVCTCLLQKEGEAPFLRAYTLPFEEDLTAPSALRTDACCMHGSCPTPAISLEEVGADTALTMDAEYSLSALLLRNEQAHFLCDLYAHGASYAVTEKPYHGHRLLGGYTGNATVSGDLPLPEDFPTADKTLLPTFTVKESTVSLHGDRAVIEGTLGVLLLAFGMGSCERTELSLPFRVEAPVGALLAEGDSVVFSLCPVGGTAQAGSTGVHLNTEMALSTVAERPFTLSLPVGAVKTEEKRLDADTVLVYYPTEEDSLFSVGKRYGVPLSRLKKQNGIPEEGDTEIALPKSLDGYAYLIVSGS